MVLSVPFLNFSQINIFSQETNRAVAISCLVVSDSYHNDRKLRSQMNWSFTVYLYNNQWSIASDVPVASRIITACDGKLIYKLSILRDRQYMSNINKYIKDTNTIEFLTNHWKKIGYDQTNMEKQRQTIGMGIIYPYNVPFEYVYDTVPWLFFILKKDLKIDIPFDCLPLPTEIGCQSLAWFYKSEILWNSTEPKLINNIKFYFDKDRILNSLSSPFLTYQGLQIAKEDTIIKPLIKALSYYTNHRFLREECNVISWTNTSYGIFPKEFEIIAYEGLYKRVYKINKDRELTLIPEKDIKPPAILYRDYGIVTNIFETTFPGVPPPFNGKISLADYRYRDLKNGIDHIGYRQIDFWPTNKLENHPTYGVSKMRPQKAKAYYKYPFIFLILTTLVIGYYLWKYRNVINIDKNKKER